MNPGSPPTTSSDLSDELQTIAQDEERCLQRILLHADERKNNATVEKRVDYDQQLLGLRDEIAAARTEDVPPLLEQMERLQGIAARQRELTQGFIDPSSPYFGRMVLREGERQREVLIGRSTYLDARAGVRIVDWRDAPVSRLYYRYAEGEDYEEEFGGRDVEGQVAVRRSVTIVERRLRRIVCPQATLLRPENGHWQTGGGNLRLAGGQGAATRASHHQKPTQLGVGMSFDAGEDKHLKEITALIDPRQFDLITKPDSGLVVIQGGAGSGKTTIGLHRLAYLAFQDRRRFRPDKMLVVVFNDALARYIAQVLPALDVNGVAVRTYEALAAQLRRQLIPGLPKHYAADTPAVVTRFKKHPALLVAIDAYVEKLADGFIARFAHAVSDNPESGAELQAQWERSAGGPLAHRIAAIKRWAQGHSAKLSRGQQHNIERELQRATAKSHNLVHAWIDLLTDDALLRSAFAARPNALNGKEFERALSWCRRRISAILNEHDVKAERESTPTSDEENAVDHGSEEAATLDVEDDTLLLLLWQRLRGPIRKAQTNEALVYEHVLVDEAQDLSPLEMRMILGCVSKARSVTLAGDVAQRLHMDNGFTGWKDTLQELGLAHVEVEPLKLSYRSTAEIVEFSRAVLGPLSDEEAPVATRKGAPVELFRFADLGDSVAFLSEALRELFSAEPQASVAVIARYPEQADLIYLGLDKAETPRIRRIAAQDFPFKPGIDVTDVRQVKGLEFDYVVLVEVSETTYAAEDEARHLLHIAATRAAHQLWLLASGKPSPLLPKELRERSY